MLKNSTLIVLLLLCVSSMAQNIIELTKNGNLEDIKKLVESDPSLINLKDNEGDIPLCTSILNRNVELSLYFIEKGADINNQNKDGYTPLHWAAMRGDFIISKALIEKKANLDFKTSANQTALFIAASRGYVELVKLLVDNNANLEIVDDYHRTPLIIGARERGGIETIKILVESGANINATDRFGDTPLSLAAWRGFEDIVDYLIEKHALVETQGEMGIKLMKHAVNKRLWNLYHKITSEGGDIVSLCPKGMTLLHIAAKGGSPEITEDLIDKGIDVNTMDIYSYAPIHYAAKYGRLDVVKTLIDHGANINIKTLLGETPYDLAKKEGKSEIVEFLNTKDVDQGSISLTEIKGKYFGQEEPGEIPELFAPGIVSNFVGGHSNVAFSADGKEAFWTEWNETEQGYADGCRVWYSKISNGSWTLPKKILKFGDTPVYSADGNKIYFMASIDQGEGQRRRKQIMYFDKENEILSEPKVVDFNIDETGLYWQFTLDSKQNIYFGGNNGLCISAFKDGKYQPHEKLSEIFHPDYRGGSPFIATDGSYLIFSSQELPDSFGHIDLYIGFKKSDGTWSEPINMGPTINTTETEHLPIVTLDGKYLFFRTVRDGISGIYWVSAKIIEELKSKSIK